MKRQHSRQRKLAHLQEARRTAWLTATAAAMLGIGLVGLPALLYGITRGASRFGLHTVEVHGLHAVPSDEILGTLDLPHGGASPDLLEMSLKETRRAVARHPWIKEVTARKAYPDRLILDVVERTPVAVVAAANGLHLVADDGVILGPVAGPTPRLPLLLGWRLPVSGGSKGEPPGRRAGLSPGPEANPASPALGRLRPGDRLSVSGLGAVAQVLAMQRLDPPPAGTFWDLRAVDVSSAREVVMQFRDVRARFSLDRLAQSWRRLLAVRADIERRGFHGELDLRFPDRVVVRPSRAV